MDKAHAEALAMKHHNLETLIQNEEHRPQPDMDIINRWKKEKLRLKDALAEH